MKKIISFLFLLSLLLLNPYSVFAQQTSGIPVQDTARTIVGSGDNGAEISPAPGGEGNAEIVTWAKDITNGLRSLSCSSPIFNRQQQSISHDGWKVPIRSGDCSGYGGQTYFCSNLVIDSYKLSGHGNVPSSVYTPTMRQQWASRAGYTLLSTNNQGSVSRLLPGDAIFMQTEDTLHHHVVVIKDIRINNSGDGSIDILQANGGAVARVYTVRNWKVIVIYNDDVNTSLWFGLAPRA